TGKSTLLNTILGEKVSIVSAVPQTTRYKIKGIFTDQRGQIVFIDTPGMHITKSSMGSYLARQIDEAIEDCDLIIHLVDASKAPGREERLMVEKLKGAKAKIILGLNKIDLKPVFLDTYIKLWEDTKEKKAQDMPEDFILIPLSGLKGVNTDKLVEVIFAHLAEGPMLYPDGVVSDFPQRLAIADIIREKLFFLMRQEVPYSLAVYVDEMQPRSNKLTYISAVILVETESQKMIVIGRNGQILKEIGQQARMELETLLEKKIFLETRVKVHPNWQQDPNMLKELAFI
ncbi:MAG: GTPase Era, partial [Deltaproteobacteria bacterium]